MLPISGERQRFPVSGKGPHTQCGSGQPGVRQIRQCSALQLRHPAAPRSTPQQRESCTRRRELHPQQRELHPQQRADVLLSRWAQRGTQGHQASPGFTRALLQVHQGSPGFTRALLQAHQGSPRPPRSARCAAVAAADGAQRRDARPLEPQVYVSVLMYVCVLFVGR